MNEELVAYLFKGQSLGLVSFPSSDPSSLRVSPSYVDRMIVGFFHSLKLLACLAFNL